MGVVLRDVPRNLPILTSATDNSVYSNKNNFSCLLSSFFVFKYSEKQHKKAKTKAGQTNCPYPPKVKSSVFIFTLYINYK